MSDALVNRVASSGLITLKPEEWAPSIRPESFDLKDYLFMGLILKEQDFRSNMKSHEWGPVSYTHLTLPTILRV